MNKEDLTTDILNFWPIKDEPRQIQLEAFAWLEQQTAKYLILEAPVGSGKSLIGMTFSRWLNKGLGNSFILTPQRILQEQYERSFDSTGLASLYGKSNYQCTNKKTSCDIGALSSGKCEFCPHKEALSKASSVGNVVLNYKLALLHFAYLDFFSEKKLMICDECHTLEQQLTEFDSINVSHKTATKIGVKWQNFDDKFKARNWLVKSYLPILEEKFLDLQAMCKPLMTKKGLNPDEIELMKEFNRLDEHFAEVAEIETLDDDELENEWILVHDKKTMSFKRLYADKSFHRILGPKADKFLFMSSTILDHEGFCRDLGIDPKEAAFLELTSEFPVDNRPVFYMPQMKMNAKWKEDDNKKARDIMVDNTTAIINHHENDSGIIHTASFAVAEFMVNQLQGNIPQKIWHHNPSSGDDRNKIIDAFQRSKQPSVLISPSITEGLDLIDDLSRFAIFTKVPFGFLGDQWIKARMNLSSEWYRRQALIQIIQGCGRVVRSPEDWGNVYITDESWGHLFNMSQKTLPQWWTDAYQVLS